MTSTDKFPGKHRKNRDVPAILVGVTVAAVFFVPVLWAVVSSLRPTVEIFEYLRPLQLATFISTQFSLANYFALLDTPMLRATINSVAIGAVTVVVGLVICSLAAFGLSAIRFRGQSVVFGVIVLSFLVPFDAIAIPLASLFRAVGLQNTYIGLILPGIADGITIFLLRQFFLGIPKELVDAGRIDGLGWWGVYRHIYIPLSVPALIGAGMILFLFQWQSYVWPLLIGTDAQHLVGPVAVAAFQGQYQVKYGVLFAGSVVLTCIPLLILLPLQRYFVQSAATSGLK